MSYSSYSAMTGEGLEELVINGETIAIFNNGQITYMRKK